MSNVESATYVYDLTELLCKMPPLRYDLVTV